MDEKFVICPFNKSHVISRLRIQYHLVKCKKSYPNCKKIICPYNATEYIDPDNFLQHLSKCKKSKGLDVTEEYKRKHFESSQHGCINNHSFQMPSHVEISDEWDIASSDSSNSCDRTITRDERNAFRLRRQSSNAIKKSYNYIPSVPNSIGRGQINEAIHQYLNRYKPPVKPVDKTAPISLADDNDNEIYDDCDSADVSKNNDVSYYNDDISNDNDDVSNNNDDVSNDNDDKVYNEKQEKYDISCDGNTCNSYDDLTDRSVTNDSEIIASNCSLKYYKPSVGRGSGISKSARSKGIPAGSIGRGITFNSNSTISSVSESFDYVLKQVVDTLFHKELLNDNRDKGSTSSEFSNGEKIDIVDNNLRSKNEKKFALTSSDILCGNNKGPHVLTKELVSKQTDTQPTTSGVVPSTNVPLNCSNSKDNKIGSSDPEVLPCSIDSVSGDCKLIPKEEHTQDSKVDDLEDRLAVSSKKATSQPLNASFGRGQLLRSINY